MLSIYTNLNAQGAQVQIGSAQDKIRTASEQLTTGLRINHSADDVSGAALANRLDTNVKKTATFIQNANNGINMIQAADNAVKQQQDLVSRMKELAYKAENGTNTSSDRALIQKEFNEMAKEVLRNETNAEFNGKKLLDGKLNAAINVGSGTENQINVKIQNKSSLTGDKVADFKTVDLSAIKIGAQTLAPIDAAAGKVTDAADGAKKINDAIALAMTTAKATLKTTPADATALATMKELTGAAASVNADGRLVIETPASLAVTGMSTAGIADASTAAPRLALIDNTGAIKIKLDGHADGDAWKTEVHDKLAALSNSYANQRADIGSSQNRLQFTIKNLQGTEQNLSKTLSSTQDTDFAATTSELAKEKVLAKASQTMLSQANKSTQEVTQLLQ
ncbi:flagellin [Photobacterium kishitanii]|uniref:Flagellin n=1 Tax=Photobacterium kishitanii TaxID=318456 RepID=A0A2T3KMS1_9GAMM|nr:flagellin [Photobacterium kishitanii]PSV01096.1 hypothetical protein C9J27_03495 [Photobacterium kishitanii]